MTEVHGGVARVVSTAAAAARVGKSPGAFVAWAHRRGLRPVARAGRGRGRPGVWDLDAVLAALDADSAVATRRRL